MDTVDSILDEWSHDYSWVFGEKDLVNKGYFSSSNLRELVMEISASLRESSYFDGDTPLPFERNKKIVVKMVDREKFSQEELDKLRAALKEFDLQSKAEREKELTLLMAQGKQLKTNNPFAIYKDK